MNKYQKTHNTWNKLAQRYHDAFMELDVYNDTYDKFLGMIKKHDARIFEIGCGPGNITRYLLSRRPGFEIYAIDTSPNMIELAKSNNPTARFEVMDCREIGSLPLKFDAIVSGFCLPYLSKDDCTAFIKNCANLLTKDGILYLSAIKGNHQHSGLVTASTGDSVYLYYYNEDFLTTMIEQNNCELLEKYCQPTPSPTVYAKEDLIFIAKRK